MSPHTAWSPAEEAKTPPTPITPSSADSAPDPTAGGFGDDFNPDHVPPFPVLTTEIAPPPLGEATWQVTVDGLPRPTHAHTEGEAAVEAIAGVAELIADRGWDACRVTAIVVGDTPDQTSSHPLIVGPAGEVWDLETHPESARRPRRRRAWKVAVLAAAALVVVGVGGAGLTGIGQEELFTTEPYPEPAEEATDQPEQQAAGIVEADTRARRRPTSWLPGVDVEHD
ncbi:hypothetical protein CGZ98_06045, partial [Enemella evansiae]